VQYHMFLCCEAADCRSNEIFGRYTYLVNPANLFASRNMWANFMAYLQAVPSTLRGKGWRSSVTAEFYVTVS